MLKAEVKGSKKTILTCWILYALQDFIKHKIFCILPFFLFLQLCNFSPFYILLQGSGFQQHFCGPRRSIQFYQNIQSLKHGSGRAKEKVIGVRDARRHQAVFFQMQNYHLFLFL